MDWLQGVGARLPVEPLVGGAFRLCGAVRRLRSAVRVIRGIEFTEGLTLDLYLPPEGVKPSDGAVLYAHGGGFQIFSKDTHIVAGVEFASRGIPTAVFDYRLAPAHPYPAAIADVVSAWHWLGVHKQTYGIAVRKVLLAGDSAGANLALATALAAALPRSRMQALLGVTPPGPASGVLMHSPFLSVADTAAWGNRVPATILKRIQKAERAFVEPARREGTDLVLADPLSVLDRPRDFGLDLEALPTTFIGVGSKDPLQSDALRAASRLRGLGRLQRLVAYEGQIHAFHLHALGKAARQSWDDLGRAALDALAGHTAGFAEHALELELALGEASTPVFGGRDREPQPQCGAG